VLKPIIYYKGAAKKTDNIVQIGISKVFLAIYYDAIE